MNRHRFTTCLLLPAMLVYLCGAAHAIHENFDHHGIDVAIHDHGHHDDQDHPSPLSQPSDLEDCSACFVLSHLAASTIDLVSSCPLPQAVTLVAAKPSPGVVACHLIHLPPGRGPPHANL